MTELERNLWKIAYLFIIAGACSALGFTLGRVLGRITEWLQEKIKKSK